MSVDTVRPSVLRELLRRHDVRPRHRLGQNFLIDRHVLERIVDTARIGPSDAAFEVGPGAGALTRELAGRCGKVVAVEIDRRLLPVLQDVLAAHRHVEMVVGDALELDWDELRSDWTGDWLFVANVPYYITAPLLVRCLRSAPPFRRAVMMVQREVAERMVAGPGGRDYGALSVLVRYYAEPEVTGIVAPRSFWPQPEVDSAIVALSPRGDTGGLPPADDFFPVVKAAFGRRRKTLRNALSRDPQLELVRDEADRALALAEIDPQRRGETLTLAEFGRLAAAVWHVRPGRGRI